MELTITLLTIIAFFGWMMFFIILKTDKDNVRYFKDEIKNRQDQINRLWDELNKRK